MSTAADTTVRQNEAGFTAIRLWALFLGLALLMAGNGLQGSLIGIVAEDSGFSSAVTGFVMAAYFLGFVVGSSTAQRFIGIVGHVRTFAALASLSSISILIHGLLVEPLAWGLMRFITGLSFAGLYVVVESWLNRESGNESRGTILAIYMIVVHAGLAAGQALLNTAPSSGLVLYVLTSIVLSAALIPILLSSAPQPLVETAAERLTLHRLLQISPLGTVGCFAAGIANGIVLGMAAVYARRLGMDTVTVSAFMASVTMGGAAFQWPIGRLSDLVDRRIIIAAVGVLMAGSASLLQYASHSPALLIGTGALVGGLALTLYPLSLAYANDWLTAEQTVSGSGALVMVYGAGAVLGPLGTGALMGFMGPQGLTIYLGLLGTIFALFTLLRIIIGERPETQEDYLVAPAALVAGEYYAETALEESTADDDSRCRS